MMCVVRNNPTALYPVREIDFYSPHIPRVGETIWLHGQSRTAEVKHVYWMVQDNAIRDAARTFDHQAASVVLFVAGNNPGGAQLP